MKVARGGEESIEHAIDAFTRSVQWNVNRET